MSPLIGTVILLLCVAGGLPFEIEVADEFTYAEKGSTVVLPCVINDDDADPFDKGAEAVTWTKYLPKDDTTGHRVSEDSKTTSQYTATGRYDVMYVKFQLIYSLQIKNVGLVDSGKYICLVGSKQRTAFLYVLDPVKTVTISGSKDTTQNMTFEPASLEYYSDRDGTFECRARGGSPKPSINVFIGDRNIGALYALDVETSKTIVGDAVGLQYYDYTVVRHSNTFRLNADDDGKKLRCVASVREGVSAPEASVNLHVIGKPTFVQCNTTVWGLLATENLEIKCGFRSWPAFSLLTWYAETTGQTIENDNSDEGLEAYVTTKSSHYEAILRIKVVNADLFQNYKLSIENAAGKSTVTIKLERGSDPAEINGADSMHRFTEVVFIAVITAILFRYNSW